MTDTDEQKRKFSFFCLKWDNNLCLGVSPGVYDPVEGLYLQLKPYMRNYYKGIESKKMRWDLISSSINIDASPTNDTEYREGYLRLEAQSPTLCADRKEPGKTNIYLFACDTQPLSTWIYDTSKGLLRLGDQPTLCATVAKCVPRTDPARSCLQDRNEVETNVKNMHEGSVIHLKPCWDYSDDYVDSMSAQTFTREIDCVAGCSPDLLSNGKCDDICNNVVCARDNGECIDSPSPTTPPTLEYSVTIAPTDPPTFGSEIGGNPSVPDTPNYWWIIFILLIACCLATVATLLRRNRRKRALDRSFEPDEGLGDTSNLVHSHLVNQEEDDGEESRFKTASAVALNQLRYHSRVANSSSTSSPHISGESVKRRPDTSSNDKRYNFEEVGLV